MKTKPATTDDYQRCVNVVVEYIRTHLDGNIDLRTLAGVSSFGSGRYAVFTYTGPYAELGGAYHKICREWLPGSGCEQRDSPCFEKYVNNPDRVPAEKLKTEIYIPVK